MPAADLLVLACLAAVLALSGASKLRAREETEDAFASLRVPAWMPRRLGAAALPWLEIALAAGLVASPSRILVVVAIAAAVLMATYTLLVARALTFDEPVTCACFGRLGGHRVDRLTLVRNVLLTGLGAWAVEVAAGGGSVPGAAGALDRPGWAAVGAAVVVALVAALVAAGGRPVEGAYGDAELDYQRTPIPFARLDFPDGTSQSLRDLASTGARLLVFLSSGCGSCIRVSEHVDDWSARLAPAVDLVTVYTSGTTEFLHHDPDLVALDPDATVRAVFNIPSAPAAVLLGADGLLAGGPLGGRNDITQLVEDVLAELESAPDAAT
ncbi:TlpA family protein disulfide reductase [Nocardioides currus]|uniref:TlpA family protein disulfide reductase n=1 Tax=Nocardioides currus TaxID=2133958 RepID=UPI001401D510|nr:MauE/DoxX family redox-associated membrane protein [Nocardioides currus]